MNERTLSERLRSFGVLTHAELIDLQLLEARLEALERWIRLDIEVTKISAYEQAGDQWETCDWTEELMSGQWDIWQTLSDETKAKIESAVQEEKE